MSNRTKPTETPMPVDTASLPTATIVASRPTLFVRRGRGRTGGSTDIDYVIQRARHQGRRVKPLDGDLRSRTLSTLYPSHDAAGVPILDGASAPASEDLPAMKTWLGRELDEMVEESVSRALDLGGGDRVLQEYARDLAVDEFCLDYDVGLTSAFYLGPDMEDFYHVLQILQSGDLKGARTLLILNEGVIRQGQTTEGVFDPILAHPDFHALVRDGAGVVVMPRLTCLDQLRERGLGFFDTIEGRPDKYGVKASPTLQHMTKTWMKTKERSHGDAGTSGWLV